MKTGSRPQYYRIRRMVQMVREGADSGSLPNSTDFMNEFEISRRTVARDLDFLRDKLLELTGLHGQQTFAQGLPDLVVLLLDLECETASHPLAQTDIATAVLNETRPLTAFLLAFDLGDHLGVHGGLGRFAARHQPTFLQGLLGDRLVVHRLLAAKLLEHLLSAIGKGEACIYRRRFWSILDGSRSRFSAARYFSGAPKREGLRTDLDKRRLIPIALYVRIESGANGGVWGLPT